MPFTNAVLLAVRPQYVGKILGGAKSVELRRVRPRRMAKGALVLIYVPSPAQSVVGAFKVERVVEMPLRDLWEVVQDKAGVTRQQFDTYFEGKSLGTAIFFSQVWSLREPVTLQDLRRSVGFHPPQGFRYAKTRELSLPQLSELIRSTQAIVETPFRAQEY